MVPVLEGDEWDSWVTIDTYKPKQGEIPDPHMNFVSVGHFQTLEIPIARRPRFPSDRRTQGAPNVAIVNETFSKKYFGGLNAVGHHFGMGIDPGTKTDIIIVGVAHDTKYETMRDEIPVEVYRPY